MKPDDYILAFFPCTRFETKIQLAFTGQQFQMKKWSDRKKLDYSMKLHEELHRNYETISKMACIAIDKNLRMVIENPSTPPHYLTMYWPLKPAIIDKDRTKNGDYLKKPTQYWFIGFEPKQNLVFEPLDYVKSRNIMSMNSKDGDKGRQTLRSEIHPQYASRFIRQYLIEGEHDTSSDRCNQSVYGKE